jgi:hypothetical protein
MNIEMENFTPKYLKIIFIFSSLFVALSVFSQDNSDYKSKSLYQTNEFGLGASGVYTEYPDFATRTGFGLNLHYCVHENVLLNWHLHFGRQYFSTSVWIPLGPLLFAASVTSGNLNRVSLSLLLLSALPDGISFPLRITDRFYITPSINPLNLDMFGKDPSFHRFYVNGNIGLGIHLKGKYFNIHPFGSVNLLYTQGGFHGFTGGLELELRLADLKK